ncbi:MAG: NAD(P)/FAD-dependent oxidoreductase [Bacteroidota bacterium]
MNQFDVIICGGGPAGSTCALALAGSGLKVAVIEKASYPRNKVCGDAIAAYVPKVLEAIHPKYKQALEAFTEKTEVDTCRVVAPNEKYIDIASAESGYIIPRLQLDNFLYQLAASENNISWFLDHEIINVSIDPELQETTITTPLAVFKSKVLIGCDGAHSITSKKLTGTQPDLNHYSGAVRAYYKNVSSIPDKTYELHFLKNVLPGYFWIFPLKNNMANVGLCIPSYAVSKRKINLRQTMEDIIKNDPSIRSRFEKAELTGKIEGYGLPLGSRKIPVSGDHFMLCGDAASLIDPATGEGIGQSMISGRYAGWQAIKCFKANDFSAAFMKQYDKQLYDKLWSTSRKSYLIQRYIFNKRWLFNGLSSVLDKSKFIKKLVLRRIMKVADGK